MTDMVGALSAQLVGLLPAGLRVVGMVALAPGLSIQQAPAQVRVLLALSLAAVLAPAVGAEVSLSDPLPFMGLCLAELAIGLALGFVAATLLEAMRFAGELLDLHIGLRAAQLFDPSSGVSSGLLSTTYHLLAVVLFVAINGHHWLLRGLAASFGLVPVGAAALPVALGSLVDHLGATIFVMALRVAAPVMAALLLADLAFGLVARAVPQINVFLVGIPAKLALGLIVAALGVPLLAHNLAALARLMAQAVDALIRAVAG